MNTTYRPRAAVIMYLPVMGTTADKDRQSHADDMVEVNMRVTHVELERNNHLEADECRFTAEYLDANIDPRFLKNGIVRLYMGNADENGFWGPDKTNLRFIGIVTHASRRSEEGGLAIEIEARDYTTLFLAQKPIPTDGIPKLTSTLKDAWAQICDHVGYYDPDVGKVVSNVTSLRDRLVFRGDIDPDIQLSKAVPARLAKHGKLGIQNGDSAWEVWQRAVMSLGLISWMELDNCIVATTTEVFKAPEKGSVGTSPLLMYGSNIIDCTETVESGMSAKGVWMMSYDHESGKTIEAFYPPPGDARIHQKRATASLKNFDPTAVHSDQYEIMEYHDITDPVQLQEICRRAYEERSRQEIQGSVKTAQMFIQDRSGTPCDLLNLGAGDNLEVSIDPVNFNYLKGRFGADSERIEYLVKRGYPEQLATILSKNLDAITHLRSVFHTKRIVTTLSDEDFEVTIEYWNRIIIDGHTVQ